MSPGNHLEQAIVRSKRILLVEDEADVRESTKMLLELDDHEITEAEDGLRGFELFQQGRFDVVITDFRMGRMDGGQLTTRIKQLAPNQPVIILTAWPDDVRASGSTPDLVVTKPYTLAELRQAVGKLVA